MQGILSFAPGYRILGILGKGGMGVVYDAEHLALGRRVALKVLAPEAVADPTALARLRREALSMGALHHPHVVQVSDFSEGPPPFLAMELLSGESLRDRLQRRGPMPYGDACLVAIQVLSALAAAHRAGIVHRDVKPANIFVVQTPLTDVFVKLLDFGIAKPLTTQGAALTQMDAIVGSAPYMAPEQIRGEAIDAKTDIFALGITLYEMIAGRRPFVGSATESVMIAILRRDPIAPLDRGPPELDAVILRALQAAPSARYLTADEMIAALLPFVPRASLGAVTVTATANAPASQTQPDSVGARPWSTSAVPPHAMTAPFGSGSTAAHVARTIDGTAALPREFSRAGAPVPVPSPPLARGAAFVLALLVPLVLALIAGVLVLLLRDRHDATGATGATATATANAPTVVDASPTVQAAAASTTKAAGASSSRRPGALPLPPAPPPAIDPASAGLAGTGPPVADGCRCDGNGGVDGTGAFCHPLVATAPRCRCTSSGDHFVMCWKPFKGATNADCPESERRLSATAVDDQPCSAFVIHGNAANERVADVASAGNTECSRCDTTLSYPRTPGARCVGIKSATGRRLEGHVFCP